MFKTNSLLFNRNRSQIITNLFKFQQQKTIAQAVSPKKDYYAILGLKKSATIEEVKKAYRLLAKKYHPDVSSKEDNSHSKVIALEKFREVAEAYAVLSNSYTKHKYDLTYKPSPDAVFNDSKMKAMDESARERDNSGNPIKESEYTKGSYADFKMKNLKKLQKEMNFDSFGNFKGGVPRRHAGGERGSAIGKPGEPYDGFIHNEEHAASFFNKPVQSEDTINHRHFMNEKRAQNTRYAPYFNLEKVTKDFNYETTDEYRKLFSYPFAFLVFLFGYNVVDYIKTHVYRYKNNKDAESMSYYEVDLLGPMLVYSPEFKWKGEKLLSRADYHAWLDNDLRSFS